MLLERRVKALEVLSEVPVKQGFSISPRLRLGLCRRWQNRRLRYRELEALIARPAVEDEACVLVARQRARVETTEHRRRLLPPQSV